MARTKIVLPGVNCISCDCEAGTVFIPVDLWLMARLRHGETPEFTGTCNLGHKQVITLTVRQPYLGMARGVENGDSV